MNRVVFLIHLNTGLSVLGDLIDVRAFKQPERDVAVPERVESVPLAFAVDLKVFRLEHSIEHFLVAVRKNRIYRVWIVSLLQPLKRQDGPGHTFIISGASFATHFDLKDHFVSCFIIHDAHVAILQALGFIGPEASVCHEQIQVVHLSSLVAPILFSAAFILRRVALSSCLYSSGENHALCATFLEAV